MATSTCAPSSTTLGLSQTFAKLKKQGKVGLIPYITAGDPDLSTTAEALKLLDACGADIIELGVPHTHPFADGPIIQASIRRALARGTDINSIVSMLKKVVPNLSCPIAMCTYFSPILDYGIPKFMATIQNAGVKGILVPGAPPEYYTTLREECMKNNIEMVLFATPTTPKDKMKKIVEESEGFVYLVSSTGVTGPRPAVNPDVQLLLQDIKKETSKAVAVGFGISKREHVKQVAEWGGDGVIVGSALVKLLGDANSADEGLLRLKDFTESLKASLP